MKSSIQLLIFLFASFGIFAQNSVLSRSGKEITVNSPATLSAQGQVKLAGDLGGTADAPTVPTLTNKVEGGGTVNYIPKFTAAKTLGNSLMFDDGTNVGIGTSSPGNTFEINQGTAGNSGLRFTNLNSSSAANTSSTKVLGLNSSGDVILTNVPGTQNIVAFSTATPTTSGVVFTPNTPVDESVVYQSDIDNSMWTYNGTAYVTYVTPSSTAWYTSGTTNDAGNSKTSNIYRTGSVGIGTNNPGNSLDVVGGFNLRNTSGTAGSNYGMEFNTNSNAPRIDWVSNGAYIGQFSSTATDFWLKNSLNNAGNIRFMTHTAGTGQERLTILNNGNVGIGTSTPVTNLHINNLLAATASVNANAQVLRLSRPTTSGSKWDNIAQFNLGSYSTAIAANSRLDLALTNGGDNTTLSNVMTWQANGNVGIGTSAPTGQLEVATTSGSSAIFRRGNLSGGASNIYLQRTQNADPNVNTAGSYATDVIGKVIFSMANGSSYPTNGNASIESFYTLAQTATNAGGGLLFKTTSSGAIASSERLKIEHNGNVGIGFVSPATGITAPASILDVSSTSSGVLVPRMTTAQRTAITLTAALKGMLVFDSDVNMFYYNVGTSWSPINVGTIKTITAAYTLLPEDNGRVLDVASASAMNITVPSTLPVGFQVSITQAGAGQVTFTAGAGMTINNRYAATKTSGQWAKAGLEVRASGSSVLSGDVQ